MEDMFTTLSFLSLGRRLNEKSINLPLELPSPINDSTPVTSAWNYMQTPTSAVTQQNTKKPLDELQ